MGVNRRRTLDEPEEKRQRMSEGEKNPTTHSEN